MLISHRKKFIFSKTVKTAGTSVESFFERYCMPEGEWQEEHAREVYVSDAGIIGYRGSIDIAKTKKWYNHQSATEIRDLIGADIWNEYFKFTVIRNPFDKLVSAFYFVSKTNYRSYTFKNQCRAYANRLLRRGSPIMRVTGKTDIDRFRNWIRLGGFIMDRKNYFIDGKVCVDYFIRFEDILGGITEVCNKLSIPESEISVPNFKKGIRKKEIPVKDYYDDEIEAIVRQRYDWELKEFNYTMPG